MLALATGLVRSGALGLNSDESVYAGQGAVLAGDSGYDGLFSLFRAHPLFVQLVVGAAFRITGPDDTTVRFVAAVLGAAVVVATMVLARRLFGTRVAVLAGLLLALLPYHVLVSRQLLLDTPMAALLAVTLVCVLNGTGDDARPAWLVGGGSAFALAVLAKETAVVALPGIGLWLLLVRRRVPDLRPILAPAALLGLAVLGPFVISRLLAAPGKSKEFVAWQFTREPNHPLDYFGRVLLGWGGIAFVALVAIGVALVVRRHHREGMLLVCVAGVELAFLTVWPTKLLPYLEMAMPLLAIAAAVGLDGVAGALTRRLRPDAVRFAAVVAVTAAAVAPAAWASVQLIRSGPERAGRLHAVTPGITTFAGGRELGEWAGQHTPDEARFMTVGPSLGNILAFYGRRGFVALGVSPDPARRNPAYVPVRNPDLALRQIAVDYLVWDSYSSSRSPFTGERLRRYAGKFGGTIVWAAWVDDRGGVHTGPRPPRGADTRIVVYDVPGGNPPGSETGSEAA